MLPPFGVVGVAASPVDALLVAVGGGNGWWLVVAVGTLLVTMDKGSRWWLGTVVGYVVVRRVLPLKRVSSNSTSRLVMIRRVDSS